MWQWYNHAEQLAAARGRSILRVNLDETAICLFPGQAKGAVFVSKKRLQGEGAQVVAKWKKRCCMTHVAMICDQPDIQPKLPQFVVGNERTLRQREMAGLRRACPPNVTLVRQKSAWNSAALTARIVRALGASVRLLGARGARLQIVLVLDAARIHFHPNVLRACSTAGIWLVFVPARMTWLLQPLDTDAFAIFKAELRRAYQRARLGSADAVGDLSMAEFLECVYGTVRRILQGRRWAVTFDRNGLGGRQSGLGNRVLLRLQLDTPEDVPATRPTNARTLLCFPRRARVALELLWASFDNVAPPRASRLPLFAARLSGPAAAPAGLPALRVVRCAAIGPSFSLGGGGAAAVAPALGLVSAGERIYGRTRAETRAMKAIADAP